MRRLIVLAAAAALMASEAQAYSRRLVPADPVVAAVPNAPEGIGCYFERGRTYCARYCYIEADGHRFCRERPHEARPQAPVEEIDELPPLALTPMK